MILGVGALAAMVALVALCGGFEREGLPFDPKRDHRAEVRSDCRSWLLAWVRDPRAIFAISRAGRWRSRGLDLAWLEERLGEFGVRGSLAALRWKRIAARRREAPLSEGEVVEEFLGAARDLTKKGGLFGGCSGRSAR